MIALGVLALSAALSQASTPPPAAPNPCDNIVQNVWDPRFTPGQQWSYHSRPTDVGSTVTISQIDDVPGIGEVVHIVVDHIKSKPSPTFPLQIGVHVSFTIIRDSLDASVLELVGNVPIPPINNYLFWRTHCLAQIYKTTVADTLTALDVALDVERLTQSCEVAKKNNLPLPHGCQNTLAKPASPSVPTSPRRTPPASAPPIPSSAPSPN